MTSRLNRRRFLKTTAAAVGAAAGTQLFHAPNILAQPAPNSKLNVAVIGPANQGWNSVNEILKLGENIVAFCDVDSKRLAGAAKKVGAGCQAFCDYRQLLQRKDIDAVIIASPDHWHAVQTIHACQAGKHVYVEKPASCTVAEGQAMVEAVRKYQRVVQVGSQARSAEPAHQVCTYIRNGMLGRVHRVT